jgi:hypothetical protein
MGEDVTKGERAIRPEMTVLDVLIRYRHTEDVFKKYDKRISGCICCNALFEPLRTLASKYGLDLDNLLKELEESVVIGR